MSQRLGFLVFTDNEPGDHKSQAVDNVKPSPRDGDGDGGSNSRTSPPVSVARKFLASMRQHKMVSTCLVRRLVGPQLFGVMFSQCCERTQGPPRKTQNGAAWAASDSRQAIRSQTLVASTCRLLHVHFGKSSLPVDMVSEARRILLSLGQSIRVIRNASSETTRIDSEELKFGTLSRYYR